MLWLLSRARVGQSRHNIASRNSLPVVQDDLWAGRRQMARELHSVSAVRHGSTCRFGMIDLTCLVPAWLSADRVTLYHPGSPHNRWSLEEILSSTMSHHLHELIRTGMPSNSCQLFSARAAAFRPSSFFVGPGSLPLVQLGSWRVGHSSLSPLAACPSRYVLAETPSSSTKLGCDPVEQDGIHRQSHVATWPPIRYRVLF
jgi:hypothetical protein